MDRIAVIIPTLATKERAPYLRRAVESVLSQSGVAVQVIVVANGRAQHDATLRTLELHPQVRCHRLEVASMPAALLAGRECVDAPYFAELDDDDELLPEALVRRVAPLNDDPDIDGVVSNCIERSSSGDTDSIPDIESVRADPLRAMTKRNWLLPGSMLFRTARIGIDLIRNCPSYLEWTYLGIRLAMTRKLVFLPVATAVHHVDLPFSINRSGECRLGRPAALGAILDLPLPPDVRRSFETKLARACNSAARAQLASRDRAGAWRWHWRSLRERGGLRYLAYTRKLFFGGDP